MKIKALWGFIGDAKRLDIDSPKVVTGQVIENADDEYAHILIGKGLVEEFDGKAKPKETKPTAPKENK